MLHILDSMRDSEDKQRVLLQTDSRGRLLLPKELRNYKLFELEEDRNATGSFLLHALKAQRISNPSPAQAMTPDDAWGFIQKKIFPKLIQIAKQTKHSIQAIVVYGSYARGEAFNTSDLDIAIFCGGEIKRRDFEDYLDRTFEAELRSLETRKIFLTLNPIFISVSTAPQTSTLAYSLASDGICVFDSQNIFIKWKAEVLDVMKARGAKRIQRGLDKVWEEKK